MIRELRISNFRGIKRLEWKNIPAGVIALIGPGDSCKTTIIEAIDVLFHGYWTLSLTENDFHNQDTKSKILIEATVSPVPAVLSEDRNFLSYLRGYDADTGSVIDEPDDQPGALTLRFTMDGDFDPSWEIVCDRHSDGARISGNKRQSFGVRRVGANSLDLRWSRGSPLASITDSVGDDATERVLRDAARDARQSASEGLASLTRVISEVQAAANRLRATKVSTVLSAELDADLTAISRGSVALHADDLPVARSGLGTQRLVSVAIESVDQANAQVLLCDELEMGLEPYRVRHLVRFLMKSGQQVWMTTHSPVVLRELSADHLVLLRQPNEPGVLKASRLQPGQTQGLVRTHAEAFLSRRVTVCEGATEVGFVRAICADLEETDPMRISFAEPVDAGGESKIIEVAEDFNSLGYEVGVVCDYDTGLDLSSLPSEISVVRCEETLKIERQVLEGATWAGLSQAVSWAQDLLGVGVVKSHLQTAGIKDSQVVGALLGEEAPPSQPPPVKEIITASTFRNGPWFKSVSGGERLALLALDPTLIAPTTGLTTYIDEIRDWCAPNDDPS